ncbi:MAG: hypothetical protein AAB790_02760 [Patescibacteria group bacterium]
MKRITHRSGLSVLETVVWIGMFAMAMAAVASALLAFYRTSSFAMQEAGAVTAAQHGIDTMTRVIREAAFASNGAYPVVSLAANDVVFYADVDSDSAIERVHYYVQGTNLYEGILNPTGDPPVYTGTEVATVIAQDVRNISQSLNAFTYYDASGVAITNYANVSAVRFVTANIAVDSDTNRPPTAVTIRSSAAMRNLVGR